MFLYPPSNREIAKAMLVNGMADKLMSWSKERELKMDNKLNESDVLVLAAMVCGHTLEQARSYKGDIDQDIYKLLGIDFKGFQSAANALLPFTGWTQDFNGKPVFGFVDAENHKLIAISRCSQSVFY